MAATRHFARSACAAYLFASCHGLLELLKRHPVTSDGVFELQIVATMQTNNVQRIYTFNTGDFKLVPELAIITP